MTKPATQAQAKVIAKIKENGGEAIRQGWCFVAGGWPVCHRSTMELMARKGLVRIETVGQSVFALPAE